MRKYQPIWKKLKDSKKVSIVADKRMHARIKRGVIKEKDEDLAFKVETDQIYGKTYKLYISSEGDVLTFQIKLPGEYNL